MERTENNTQLCFDLANRFRRLRRMAPPPGEMDEAIACLAEVFLAACTGTAVAQEITALILESEEYFPAEATIRRYMRREGYAEVDVRARETAKLKRERDEQKRRWREEDRRTEE